MENNAMPVGNGTPSAVTTFSSALPSSQSSQVVNKASAKEPSLAAEWIAPIIVWFAVISMGLAVVWFLLSPAE